MIKLQADYVWQLFILLFIMFLIMSMLSNVLQQRERKPREKIVVYTVLACINNDYEERREFIPGDYVGKIVKDKRCPKDNSELRIKAIYAEKQQIGK
ncbi:MAG: hypothetical protein QXI22_02505 [Sulfolobales archaeon]